MKPTDKALGDVADPSPLDLDLNDYNDQLLAAIKAGDWGRISDLLYDHAFREYSLDPEVALELALLTRPKRRGPKIKPFDRVERLRIGRKVESAAELAPHNKKKDARSDAAEKAGVCNKIGELSGAYYRQTVETARNALLLRGEDAAQVHDWLLEKLVEYAEKDLSALSLYEIYGWEGLTPKRHWRRVYDQFSALKLKRRPIQKGI